MPAGVLGSLECVNKPMTDELKNFSEHANHVSCIGRKIFYDVFNLSELAISNIYFYIIC